jgi:hypothetical protein
VQDQITCDKAERAAKFGKKTEAPATSVGTPATAAPAAPLKEYKECRLQIRLPDGSTLTHVFGATEALSAVRQYVELNRKDGALPSAPFKFMTSFPKKEFSLMDMNKPLCELGLVPSAVLIVTKSEQGESLLQCTVGGALPLQDLVEDLSLEQEKKEKKSELAERRKRQIDSSGPDDVDMQEELGSLVGDIMKGESIVEGELV